TAFYHYLTGLNLNSPGQLAAPWHGAHYRHSAQSRNPSNPLFWLFYAVCSKLQRKALFYSNYCIITQHQDLGYRK
ncbi:hypothetical protein QE250_07465, partial [Chromatiaceae bacterium AAb-1]|nr:hypothetical protein [Chromatiaceae bacterium AAb-1]